MNKEKFYGEIRGTLKLTEKNVQGFETVLDYLILNEDNINQVAYILATVWWETANTMQPITEYGSQKYLRGKKYWPYIGRGYVQLTWDYNYKKASKVCGVDFLKYPDRVMEPIYALPILYVGMKEGWYGPKGLDAYIDDIDESDSEDLKEYKQARRTVNVQDKAEAIGKIALIFERALKASGYKKQAVNRPAKPVEKVSDTSGTKTPETKENAVRPSTGILEAIINFIIKKFIGG